jgi:sugar phosphate isomerase/epimerase
VSRLSDFSRRDFLAGSLALGAAAIAGPLAANLAAADEKPAPGMKLGLCTYLWGQYWDLPTIIDRCTKAEVLGVELRTQHKHGVEPSLGAAARKEVKRRFAASPVTLVGLGTNECYHHTDPATLKKAIEASKAFIRLSHDCGGSGVKVKPNDLPKGVAREKTIAQIGKSLNELGRFGADLGQQIRLEVHGGCSELPIIRQIMDVADHPNVGVCWNSNPEDLRGKGLAANFGLVKARLGATVHVRELNSGDYPYAELFKLLQKAQYGGWVLLECRKMPADGVAAMIEQRKLFARMTAS